MKQSRNRMLIIVSVVILMSIGMLNAFTIRFNDDPKQTESISQIDTAENSFVLPASLITIEEDAFSGTLAEEVILQGNVETIEDGAFSRMALLDTVIVPDSTKYIADNAFAGSPEVVLFASKGSYAENWARENRISFINKELWVALHVRIRTAASNNECQSVLKEKYQNNDKLIISETRDRDQQNVSRRKDRAEMNYQIGLFP